MGSENSKVKNLYLFKVWKICEATVGKWCFRNVVYHSNHYEHINSKWEKMYKLWQYNHFHDGRSVQLKVEAHREQ